MAFNWTTSNEGLLIIEAEVAEELKSALDTLETVNIAYDGSYNSVHKSGHYETYDSSYYTTHLGSNRSSHYSVNKNMYYATYKGTYKSSHNTDYDSSKSCFIAGTKVLLADGSWKNIEDFVGGELIVGLTKINKVTKLLAVPLTDTRIIYTLTNEKIYFTGEHKFWTKFVDDTEGPTVHNYGEYHYDWLTSPKEEEPTEYPHVSIRYEKLKYATIWGWSEESWKFNTDMMRQYDPNMLVYSLQTENEPDHTMIANGYVTSAWMAADTDYNKIKWDSKKVLNGINVKPLKI